MANLVNFTIVASWAGAMLLALAVGSGYAPSDDRGVSVPHTVRANPVSYRPVYVVGRPLSVAREEARAAAILAQQNRVRSSYSSGSSSRSSGSYRLGK